MFYRAPSCVPPSFNLLNFFHPAAFGCESFVRGFEIWRNGPWAGDAAPLQQRLDNTGPLPVWFVAWSVLEAAIADDRLTIGELASLPSLLVGHATRFRETLHPYQGAQQTMISIVASGVLENGHTFIYQATETHGVLRHVRIEFQ